MPYARRLARCCCLVSWALGLGTSASAAAVVQVADFHGGQARGMGLAHRAVGTSPQTLLLNPAGMAFDQHYSLDMSYGYRGPAHLHDTTLSLIDGKSAPSTIGLQLARSWGNPSDLDAKLYRGAVGTAIGLGEHAAFGLTLRRQWGELNDGGSRRPMAATTATLGVLLRLGRVAAIGASWEHLFRVKEALRGTLPPAVAVGLRLGPPRLQAAADLRRALDDAQRRLDVAVGGEALLGGSTALRLGYRSDGRLANGHQHILSAGLGAFSPSGHLHLSLERPLGPAAGWSVATGLQMAL